MSSELARIGISVYTRINHFKQCIESLQKNILANQSELFIYSDAPSKPDDEDLVKEVREYVYSIIGFKKVHVIERERNYGGTQNASQAHFELMKKFDNSIFLEDDIVTAPGFLTFMNQALEFYKDDDRILSITGYCPPIKIPEDYNQDSFILQRFCGWGAGIWQDKMEQVPKKIDINKFRQIRNKRKIFTVDGDDVLNMIYREVKGQLDAQDVRNMYYQAINNKYTIYPKKSLVQNIGHDGTGVHCGSSTIKFWHDKLWDKVDGFEFNKKIMQDERIIKRNRKFRSIGLRGKLIIITKLTGLYPALKKVKEIL